MDRRRSLWTYSKNSRFCKISEHFGARFRTFWGPADECKRLDPHTEQEVSMTILETIRTGDNAVAAPQKSFVVQSGAGYCAEQAIDYEPGVSAETVGSKSIWLGMITLPPGKRTRAHVHKDHETAFYMLSGDEMELWTGDQLQYRDIVRPGDYIFIPANMLHVAVNRGDQSAVLIGSRSGATGPGRVGFRTEMGGGGAEGAISFCR